MNNDIGSMALRPRRPEHVHGDGDDGTTTRWEKACAMSDKIDLPLARKSMQHHSRTRIVISIVCVAVVVALALRYLWRASYGL
jgi:hypothetical protein